MFVFQNMPDIPELRLGDTLLSVEAAGYDTSRSELIFTLTSTPVGLSGSIQYNTDLYKEATISLMLSHFEELLSSLAATPDEQIGLLRMLPSWEEQALLYGFNDRSTAYPKEKSIVTLFEEQVKKAPERTALIFGQERLSYKALNHERSNQLARHLPDKKRYKGREFGAGLHGADHGDVGWYPGHPESRRGLCAN